MPTTLEQQIRERAFHLWQQAGRPHGQADHHWLMAEREICAATKKAPAKKAAGPKPAAQPRGRKLAAEMRH